MISRDTVVCHGTVVENHWSKVNHVFNLLSDPIGSEVQKSENLQFVFLKLLSTKWLKWF